jgi:hypothetical protein
MEMKMGTTAVNLSYHGSGPVRTVDLGNGAQVVPQAKLAGAGGIFGRTQKSLQWRNLPTRMNNDPAFRFWRAGYSAPQPAFSRLAANFSSPWRDLKVPPAR